MIALRPGAERGRTRFDWLDSRHTFSFGSYFDPQFRGVSDLVAINDDRVLPSAGFARHPHRDMEIISYLLEGSIEHRDSMDNHRRLKAGEVQVMSAGTGVQHSEYNPSDTEELRFLQIWVLPDQGGYEPRYEQQDFAAARGITPVVTPEGRDGSLAIRQDASIYQLRFANRAEEFVTAAGRIYYLQIAQGSLVVNGVQMDAGDGAFIREEGVLQLQAGDDLEAVLIDLRGA